MSPRPPSASGASMPTTPMSASLSQRPGTRPVSFVHAARTCAGVHSLSSSSRTASRNASWSSVNAKRMVSASAFRGRAPRSRCAGSRSCPRRSGPRARTRSPSSTRRCRRRAARRASPSRSSASSCRRTSSSDQKTFTIDDSAPALTPSTRRVTVQNVCQRYASASMYAATTRSRSSGIVAVRVVQVDQPLRGREEAARASAA